MSRAKISKILVMRQLMMLLVPVFLLCYVSNCPAAGKKRTDVFRDVPANLRPQLIKKLNRYILLRKTRQWGPLYDLYSKRYLARRWPPLGMSREEFIQGNRQDDAIGRGSNLLRFKADKVRFIPGSDEAPARAFILGCGEYYATKAGTRVGRSKRLRSVIEVLFEDGEWRTTDVVVDYKCEGCEADKCRMN